MLTSWLTLIDAGAWRWLLYGCLTHMIIDTCNIQGVPLLWPKRLEFVMVYNRSWRVPYGSPKEMTLLAAMAIMTLAIFPMTSDGFGPWFHRAIGTTNGAVQDFLRWRDHYELFVNISGDQFILRKHPDERLKVLDALDPHTLLVEDSTGRAYAASGKGDVQIHAFNTRLHRGDPIDVHRFHVDLSGRLLSDLLNLIPANASHVYINAALEVIGEYDLVPKLGEFERLQRIGRVLHLRSATRQDIYRHGHLAIEDGVALVRTEFPKDIKPAKIGDLPGYKITSKVLQLTGLPSIDGLAVEIGDKVNEGELIARYIDDAKLEMIRSDAHNIKLRIEDKTAEIAALRKAHDIEKEALTQKISHLEENVSKTAYLVERHAEPKAKLTELKAQLRESKHALLVEKKNPTLPPSSLSSMQTSENNAISSKK